MFPNSTNTIDNKDSDLQEFFNHGNPFARFYSDLTPSFQLKNYRIGLRIKSINEIEHSQLLHESEQKGFLKRKQA
jgi:hypothetical protein